MSAAGWSQFRADSAGQGSRFVVTQNSLTPAWSLDVGHVVFSSPVIGGDGTIYVGNVEGELIAVNPDGTVKWRFDSGVPILASPAVADDGFVYLLGTERFPDATPPDHKLRGQLSKVKAGVRHDFTEIQNQGFTTGSPKVFTSKGATFVVLHARTRVDGTLSKPSKVLVYDEKIKLAGIGFSGCGDPEVAVGEGLDIFGSIVDFLKKIKELNDFDDSFTPEPVPLDVFGALEPSVAVAHRPDLGPPEQTFIVVADTACATVTAFRWMLQDLLEPVWQHTLTVDSKPLRLSSPAVLNNASLVVIGTRDGKVMAFDLADGTPRWVTDIGEAVLATPASLDEVIFVTSSKSVHALNPITGAKVRQHVLNGSVIGASAAVSKNHVHVQTLREISTLSLDFSLTGHDDNGFGGTSSPALGADGTVYAIVQPGDPKQLERDVPSKLVSYPPPKPPVPGIPSIPSPNQPAEDVP